MKMLGLRRKMIVTLSGMAIFLLFAMVGIPYADVNEELYKLHKTMAVTYGKGEGGYSSMAINDAYSYSNRNNTYETDPKLIEESAGVQQPSLGEERSRGSTRSEESILQNEVKLPNLQNIKGGSSDASTAPAQVSAPVLQKTVQLGSADVVKLFNEANAQGTVQYVLSNNNTVTISMKDDNAYFSVRDNKGKILLDETKINNDAALTNSYVSDFSDRGNGSYSFTSTSYSFSEDDTSYRYNSTQRFDVYNGAGIEQRTPVIAISHDYVNKVTQLHDTHFENIAHVGSGDFNNDNLVDLQDFSIIKAFLNKNIADVPYEWRGVDINNDGIVDMNDYHIFLGTYGANGVSALWVSTGTAAPSQQNIYTSQSTGNTTNALSSNSPNIINNAYDTYRMSELVQGVSSAGQDYSGNRTRDDTTARSALLTPTVNATQPGGDPYQAIVLALAERNTAIAAGTIIDENSNYKDGFIRLASMLENPTKDQKEMLDAAESMLKEMQNIEKGSESPELKKVADDLLQMVAAIASQAYPDLLKEGDAANNIKGIFSELRVTTDGSIKKYYNEIVGVILEDMSRMTADEANTVLGGITKEAFESELRKAPGKLNETLDKIRNMRNKSAAAQDILDKEKESRQRLERAIKAAMGEFTRGISNRLDLGAVNAGNKGKIK